MARKELLYPGISEAEEERSKWRERYPVTEGPDFIPGKPNYSKFIGWPPEEVLAHLNID